MDKRGYLPPQESLALIVKSLRHHIRYTYNLNLIMRYDRDGGEAGDAALTTELNIVDAALCPIVPQPGR